jgi:transcriptional regulator with XRE-family HTH domain
MAGNSLGAFLKAMRQRLDRDIDRLGSYERLPDRRGRAVSQEELAEAVDVSRGWYSLLESGASMRASMGLLSRIADALMLAEHERSELFVLALPDFPIPSLQPLTLQVIDAFAMARAVSHNVWNASSEMEALAVLSETAAAHFPDADYVGTYSEFGLGQWTFPDVDGRESLQQRVTELSTQACGELDPSDADEVMCHPFALEHRHRIHDGPESWALTKAGRVLSKDEGCLHMRCAHVLDDAFARAGVPGATFVNAHIRSGDGFKANLFVCHFTKPQAYSEVDRAMLSAVTDLASLTLTSRTAAPPLHTFT